MIRTVSRDPRSTDALTAFSEFLAARVGPNWVIAPRLSSRLKDRGYEVALSADRYAAFEADHRATIRAVWSDLSEVERIALMLAEADGTEPRFHVDKADKLFCMGFRVSDIGSAQAALAA